MRDYTSIIKTQNPITIEKDIDGVTAPFTLAQVNIRRNFMEIANTLYSKKSNEDTMRLLNKAAIIGEEYLTVRPKDFIFMTTLADFYTRKGNPKKELDYLKKGEKYFDKILKFAPHRPDMNYLYAVNLYYQQSNDEAFINFEKAINLSPHIYNQYREKSEEVYVWFIKYFYEKKDKANFIKVADRLKENNYSDTASLDKILDYLDKNGIWPRVNFE